MPINSIIVAGKLIAYDIVIPPPIPIPNVGDTSVVDWSSTTTETIVVADPPTSNPWMISFRLSGNGNYLALGYNRDIVDKSFIYLRTGQNEWTEQTEISGVNSLGRANAFDYEGEYLAVITASSDVYFYKRTNTTWNSQSNFSDSGTSYDVTMSGNGLYCAVGAGTKTRVYYNNNDTWEFQADLSNGGFQCALDYEGVYCLSSTSTDGNGSTYIYKRTGTDWSLQQIITDGSSCAISGDGTHLCIGNPTVVSNTGTVYIYTRDNDTWSLEGEVQGSDKTTGNDFGYHVAMNYDGLHLVVGTKDQGTKYAEVFKFDGNNWSRTKKFTNNSTGFGGSTLTGAQVVDINYKGDRIVVGGVFYTNTLSQEGGAFVYNQN